MIEHHIKLLVGRIIAEVIVSDYTNDITFICKCGHSYRACNTENYCETVRMYDVMGDLDSLVGQEIVEVAECLSHDWPSDVYDSYNEQSISFTWTTYTIRSKDTTVVIRWIGTSNGSCCEEVYFDEVFA